ncbi:MAG: transcription antitermination factor NusB [Alphaproteobacteria bacterium]
MANTDSRKKSRGSSGPRRTSRLAAVQAIYQSEMTGVSPQEVLGEFVDHRARDGSLGLGSAKLSEPLLTDLVLGVAREKSAIEAELKEVLTLARGLDQIEPLVRAVLRAGAYELLRETGTPARAIVSEYVEVADAFFEDRQTRFVNGVLDGLARRLRADEMQGGKKDGGENLR